MVCLLLVAGTLFASLVFSYFYLWTVAPEVWPDELPALWHPLIAAGLLLASSGVIASGSRSLQRNVAHGPGGGHWPVRIALLVALLFLVGAFAIELHGQWQAGLTPTESSYGAIVYMAAALQGQFVVVLVIMGLYTVARSLRGLLDGRRRATFDNTMLLWHYTVAQGLVTLAVVHGFPRLAG